MAKRRTIISANLALAPGLNAYNVYAVTLWSYRAQLVHFDEHIFHSEKRVLHMLLKLPWQ